MMRFILQVIMDDGANRGSPELGKDWLNLALPLAGHACGFDPTGSGCTDSAKSGLAGFSGARCVREFAMK
jgi:hypothetical protein